ncbi:EAL domain-containing protein [Oceanicaulis sp. LC35]|uniref:EAL domain-containing protein n=1 Tax=Oceanicaulis sp. LC35 TaxID=3349635 RepID=UPI003F84B841
MPRASDILVILTYAMVAIVAALAFDRFGLMSAELAWMMGALVFLIGGQVHASVARAEERKVFEDEIHQLKAANLTMLDELSAAQDRIDALAETATASPSAPVVEAPAALELNQPLAASSGDAHGADERLVAEILARLDGGRGAPMEAQAPDAADLVRRALDDNRVDLYLQPVVGLPQRRTYFYEGYTRIRDESGQVIAPVTFLKAAEEAGLITDVDNLLLLRCVQIVRRLTKSDRRVGVFCNVSIRSLADEDFFPAFLDFLRRNSDLAGALIFEMPRAQFENRSALAARNMARLADFGFRFSIDQVNDLNIDLAELQRAGVRFIKVAGDRLIAAAHGAEPIAGREPGALRPEDVAGLFARYGVDLVAEKIESESTVVEVLDLDVAYAQGHLFGAPRPVRDEVISEADNKLRRAAG